jgi:hypothetical protein
MICFGIAQRIGFQVIDGQQYGSALLLEAESVIAECAPAVDVHAEGWFIEK